MNDDLPQSAIVTLDVPVRRGEPGKEQVIEQVTLIRPKGAAMKNVAMLGLTQLDYDEVRKVLPRITTPPLTPADVDRMDPADILSCGMEIVGFLLGSKARTDSQPT